METTDSAHPIRFDIDYPEEPRNRLMVAFRLILAIPILAVLAAKMTLVGPRGRPWAGVALTDR